MANSNDPSITGIPEELAERVELIDSAATKLNWIIQDSVNQYSDNHVLLTYIKGSQWLRFDISTKFIGCLFKEHDNKDNKSPLSMVELKSSPQIFNALINYKKFLKLWKS